MFAKPSVSKHKGTINTTEAQSRREMAGIKNKNKAVQQKPTGARFNSLVSGCSNVMLVYAKMYVETG